MEIPMTKNFIGIAKDLINFVKDSPKRLVELQAFQGSVSVEHSVQRGEKIMKSVFYLILTLKKLVCLQMVHAY